jgi:hypothetical protein
MSCIILKADLHQSRGILISQQSRNSLIQVDLDSHDLKNATAWQDSEGVFAPVSGSDQTAGPGWTNGRPEKKMRRINGLGEGRGAKSADQDEVFGQMAARIGR